MAKETRTRVIVEEKHECLTPPGMELGTPGMCHAYNRRKQDFCDGCAGDGHRWVTIKSKVKKGMKS